MGFPISIFLATLCSSLLLLQVTAQPQQTLGFRCNTTRTCNSLIDYKLPNTTTLSAVRDLFNLKNLRSILAANNLPLTTPINQTFPASEIIKIPFPCRCRNGFGISDHRPNYTVVPNDGLYHIAAEVFSNLVTFQQIQVVNNISNPDQILVGQVLQVPLPCSCDVVDGERVVHYGHVVAAGSTVSGIAQEFNTTENTLLMLNGMNSSAGLLAGSVIDVPLKACASMVRNDSLDYPLLVANDTYTFTANNCVRCQCNAANNWILQCEPSGLSLPGGRTCSSIQCTGTSDPLYLGNATSSSNCSHTSCVYAGYQSNGTIFTSLNQESTCPVNNDNGSFKFGMQWSFLLGAFMLYLHLVR